LVPLMETIQFLSSQDVLYAPLSDDTTDVSSSRCACALARSERAQGCCHAGPIRALPPGGTTVGIITAAVMIKSMFPRSTAHAPNCS